MSLARIVDNTAATEFYIGERCHIIEWWNSPEDAQASMARVRVEPGVATRLHRLRGVSERYLILHGRGRMQVGELAPTQVGPGDVAVIPAGVAQRIVNLGDEDLVFLAVCTPRFLPECYEDLEAEVA